MKVNYILHSNEGLASHRYRASSIAQELRRLGHEVAETQEPLEEQDAYVFMKHWQEEDLARAGRLKLKGRGRIIYDISDDHFGRQAGPFYEKMCKLAHVITCPTKTMKERIEQVTNRTPVVIPDPALFPYRAPRQVPNPPKILWFGHLLNYQALLRWAREDSNLARTPITVISNIAVTPAARPTLNPKWTYLTWAPNLVENMAADFHIALVPTLEDSWARTKSPNRVVEAIQSGLFVITNGSVPSYEAFKPYAFFGEPSKGIAYAVNRPGEVLSKVKAGQEFVQQYHNLQRVALQWQKVLTAG